MNKPTNQLTLNVTDDGPCVIKYTCSDGSSGSTMLVSDGTGWHIKNCPKLRVTSAEALVGLLFGHTDVWCYDSPVYVSLVTASQGLPAFMFSETSVLEQTLLSGGTVKFPRKITVDVHLEYFDLSGSYIVGKYLSPYSLTRDAVELWVGGDLMPPIVASVRYREDGTKATKIPSGDCLKTAIIDVLAESNAPSGDIRFWSKGIEENMLTAIGIERNAAVYGNSRDGFISRSRTYFSADRQPERTHN